MADLLTDEEIAHFKEAFSLFDRNDRGIIPAEELGTVMRVLGKIPSQVQIDNLIREVDGHRTGFIDFPDFLTIITQQIKDRYYDEEEVREAFRVFDKDDTGFISEEDFRQIIINLGEDMTSKEINEMIADAKIDENGLINYENFVTAITNNEVPTYNYLKRQVCPYDEKKCYKD